MVRLLGLAGTVTAARPSGATGPVPMTRAVGVPPAYIPQCPQGLRLQEGRTLIISRVPTRRCREIRRKAHILGGWRERGSFISDSFMSKCGRIRITSDGSAAPRWLRTRY